MIPTVSPSPDLCDESCVYSLATSVLVYLIVLTFSQILVGVICVSVKAIALRVDPSFFSEFAELDDIDEKQLLPSIQTTKRQALIDQATITTLYSINEEHCCYLRNEYKTLPIDARVRICEDAPVDEVACSICLFDYQDGDTIGSSRTCRHSFHKVCISQWLQCHHSCPCCRADVMIRNDDGKLSRTEL